MKKRKLDGWEREAHRVLSILMQKHEIPPDDMAAIIYWADVMVERHASFNTFMRDYVFGKEVWEHIHSKEELRRMEYAN